AAWAIAEVLAATRKPLDIQVTATDAGLDVDVRGSGPLTTADMTTLAQVADRRNLARLTRHGDIVAQRTLPVIRIGRAQLVLPPGAFLQATMAGEAIWARLVEAHCGGAGAVADLFCGVGSFALRLAERARVTAADNDADAIAALRRAAAGAQGLKPLAAQLRDLFRSPLVAAGRKRVDAVVFDPPRQGAEAAGAGLGGTDRAAGGPALLHPRALRARRAHPRRRGLSSRARAAGRSILLSGACGSGRVLKKIIKNPPPPHLEMRRAGGRLQPV